jgi:hypothetical protein
LSLARPLAVFSFLLGVSILSAAENSHALSPKVAGNVLPIVFEPASSQPDGAVAMIGRAPGMTLGFRPASIVLDFSGTLQFHIEFGGAQPVIPRGAEPLRGTTNYLLGNDPAHWRVHVPNYAKVIYTGLYPGIDAAFYGNGRQFEHDFIVSPGGDYRQICMHFPNNARVSLDKDGTLNITIDDGLLQMQKPVIYQEEHGKRQLRSGSFRVQPNGDVGFRIGSYDSRQPLVIDPVLTFSTYLSPLGSVANLIATDASGNNYVSGIASLGFPVTPDAFAGCVNCTTNNVVTFISKLSADGTTLIYSTVLGGNSFAQPTGIAVDANGNVLVSGWTAATDFPTKSGQPIATPAGNYVGFLVSLSADGSSLNYGTLLGSSPSSGQSNFTYANAVALDSSGNAYVTGNTGNGFFTSPGALNQGGGGDFGNQFNVFLVKLSPTGGLLYSAVLGAADPQNGGGGPIGVSAITIDSSGDAYVAGQAGTLWPISAGAYLSQISGSMPYADPFVTGVSPDATSLLYSTYLDYAYQVTGIVVLPNGDVFVTGYSVGATYPTTPNAYQQNSGSGGAAFLTELNSNGSSLVYSTVIGDSTYRINGLELDPNGNIWLAAQTANPQFPLVTPLQSVFPFLTEGIGNGPASVVSQFDPAGQTLEFSTFLGGAAFGYASSIAIDTNHRAHIAGAADYGMYTTPGVYDGQVPMPAPNVYPTYAYVAMVDTTVPTPALCVSPNVGLTFGSVPVGTFADQPITITSCGTQPLTISSASAAASMFTVPASENGCTQAIPVGQNCTLSVRYTATAGETDSSTLSIQSNASIPLAVMPLTGTGVLVPIAALSLTSLTFTSQAVGTSSTAQAITLYNTGLASLSVVGIALSGSGAGSFAQTNTCGSTLSVGQSCVISVVFTPIYAGTVSATLWITDNAGTSPQLVNLSGTAAQTPFTIAPQAGGSTSSTVAAGQPANYALSISPANGYTGTVSLTCSNLPVNASCSFAPASIALTGGLSAPFTLTISTLANEPAAMLRNLSLGSALVAFLFLLPLNKRRQRGATLTALSLLLFAAAISSSACGGGSSGSGSPTTVAPGNYNPQVVASDGTASQTLPLTLIVQ